MLFGGWQKFSAIDYPGKASTIVFTQGCPFRCPFCHNPELVDPEKFEAPIDEAEIFEFLNRRKGRLDAVVITGGEPTMQKGLLKFMEKIKVMDYLIKLDTNGSHPDVLNKVLQSGMVDYLAMDIKSPMDKYQVHTVSKIQEEKIRNSISLVMASKLPYEFRTTVVKEQLNLADLLAIGEMIQGAELYILQKFNPQKTLDINYQNATSYTDEEFDELVKKLSGIVKKVEWR
jgi:pyruvate formate lyase activating enzyme